MKTVKIGRHEFKFYSSIKDMPVEKYNTLQLFLLQDTGIGSNMSDIDRHFHQLDIFLNAGKISEAISERQNLHMNIYAMLEKINIKSKSLACFIHSVDGREVGYDDELIESALSKLNAGTIGEVTEILEELKKNCISN
jgi:hypothetical protein